MKLHRFHPRPPVDTGLASRRAFTLLELMLALAIFAMVIAAVYSTWTAVLRASRAGAEAAADLQRSRIAARALEDSLVSAVMFQANQLLYSFEADTSGEFAALSFVARLPSSFLGSGYFGDQLVRRVTFTVESAPDGGNQLMLTQVPLLQTNQRPDQVYSVVLARDVTMFTTEFFDPQEGWMPEWTLTNQLPRQVHFMLQFGRAGQQTGRRGITDRVVDIPSVMVNRQWQLVGGMPLPGQGIPGPGQVIGGAAPGAGSPAPVPPVQPQGGGP